MRSHGGSRGNSARLFVGTRTGPAPILFLAGLLVLAAALEPTRRARAEEPAPLRSRGEACTRADAKRAHGRFQSLFASNQYEDAVAALLAFKGSCWTTIGPDERAAVAAEISLAAARAGNAVLCNQILDAAPRDLDPASKLAKSLAFNRGLCAGLAVAVMPTLHLASPQEATAALARVWTDDNDDEPYRLRRGRLPGRQQREIRSCADLDGVGLDDIDVTANVDAEPLEAQMIRCEALKVVAAARPAQRTYVRDVVTMKDPGAVLPVALAPAFSREEGARVDRAQRAGKSWRAYDRTLRIEIGDRGARRELMVTGDDLAGVLQWWALGDFDGDGVEDILVSRTVGPATGTAADAGAFVLTRTKPSGVLQVIRRLGPRH